MQEANCKLNTLVGENLHLLYEKIAQEVRAERKYSQPLMSSWEVEGIAHWLFSQYVLTN